MIIKARQHSGKADHQKTQTNGILDIPRPPNVPVEVEAVVGAQVEEIPPVSLMYFYRFNVEFLYRVS